MRFFRELGDVDWHFDDVFAVKAVMPAIQHYGNAALRDDSNDE
jgi:hypothetical protein